MNQGQFKDPLCYLCLSGTVVKSQSVTQEVVGTNKTILLIFFFATEFSNSVKTFRKNSNEGKVGSLVHFGVSALTRPFLKF